MRGLSVGLACVLFLECLPPAGAQETPVAKLNFVIVEGEGAINNIRLRTARAPIIQVEDENHRPVAGAAVVFSLPQQGASGAFSNGSRTLTVMTDDKGQAVGRGLRPNNLPGRVEIRVTASKGGQSISATIVQTNAALGVASAGVAAGISVKWLAIIGGIAGAAAAGGVIAATRNGGAGPAGLAQGPPTSVSAGAGTIGPPR